MSEKSLLDYLVKNKEIYHLWFEYLRENEVYKAIFQGDRSQLRIMSRDKHNIRNTYIMWENIYNITWEDTFVMLQSKLINFIGIRKAINYDYSNTKSIVALIHDYENLFRKNNPEIGRDSTLREFRDFCEMVDAVDNFPKPSRSLPPKEIKSLWKNLEIWRAVKRDELTIDDAIVKVDPEKKVHTGHALSVYRSWKRDIAYADKIIKNAGRGLFPGPYKSGVKAQ